MTLFNDVVPGTVTVTVVTQSVLVVDCVRAQRTSLARGRSRSDLMLETSRQSSQSEERGHCEHL